jgi:dihydrofolate synthase / folylpolyglutamate synthase
VDYKKALEFVYGSTDYERFLPPVTEANYDLGRFRALLQRLGNPQDSFRSIHIAGSKGKGSVAHYLAGILTQAGFRTGLYTSPHLCTPRERTRLNGVPLPPVEFAQAAGEVSAAFSGSNRDDYRTVFEILSAMAFCAFRQCKVDVAVLEAGLGGRLDATNVVKPVLGIITPIVLEHTDILGRTLAEIAAEKAGIIKPGMEVLLAKQNPAAMEVLRYRAMEAGVNCYLAGDLVRAWKWESPMEGERFNLGFKGQPGVKMEIITRGWGRPRVEAARLAASACLLLQKLGFRIKDQQIALALSHTRIPARIEPVITNPLVIVDVAHHPIAIEQLSQALAVRSLDRVMWVFGANRDKSWHKMLNCLLLQGEEMHLCAAKTPRAVDAHTLAGGITYFPGTITMHGSVAEAVRAAIAAGIAKRLPVAITGSFYVAGEALQELGLCE